MWIVARSDVDPVTFGRLGRDRVVTRLHADCALPVDIPLDAGVRAASLAHAVPTHTALTGLGALWVRGIGEPPTAVTVVGAPGAHRIATPGRIPSQSRTSQGTLERAELVAGVRCARLEDAAADALRWEPLAGVYPTLAHAIAAAQVDSAGVADAVAGRAAGAPGRARMVDAWETLSAALGASWSDGGRP